MASNLDDTSSSQEPHPLDLQTDIKSKVYLMPAALISLRQRLPQVLAVTVSPSKSDGIHQMPHKNSSDGYSQIIKICDAMREQQKYCLGYMSKNEIASPQFD